MPIQRLRRCARRDTRRRSAAASLGDPHGHRPMARVAAGVSRARLEGSLEPDSTFRCARMGCRFGRPSARSRHPAASGAPLPLWGVGAGPTKRLLGQTALPAPAGSASSPLQSVEAAVQTDHASLRIPEHADLERLGTGLRPLDPMGAQDAGTLSSSALCSADPTSSTFT